MGFPGHHQKQLTQNLIARLLKTHFFVLILIVKGQQNGFELVTRPGHPQEYHCDCLPVRLCREAVLMQPQQRKNLLLCPGSQNRFACVNQRPVMLSFNVFLSSDLVIPSLNTDRDLDDDIAGSGL